MIGITLNEGQPVTIEAAKQYTKCSHCYRNAHAILKTQGYEENLCKWHASERYQAAVSNSVNVHGPRELLETLTLV